MLSRSHSVATILAMEHPFRLSPATRDLRMTLRVDHEPTCCPTGVTSDLEHSPLIVTISGTLVRVSETAVTIEATPFEYEVLVADYTRRLLQNSIGQPTRLYTLDYIEGNAQGGRLTPRLIGFMTDLALSSRLVLQR